MEGVMYDGAVEDGWVEVLDVAKQGALEMARQLGVRLLALSTLGHV
jgi:hypothetical protein